MPICALKRLGQESARAQSGTRSGRLSGNGGIAAELNPMPVRM